MKRFEKCLKTVIDEFNSKCVPLYLPECSYIHEAESRFLAAKGLVELTAAGDDTFYISPTDKGLTYFSDKREARCAFWREHVVNFVGGFVCGVLTTILSTVIIRGLL